MRYLRRAQPLPTTADQPTETDAATLFSGVLYNLVLELLRRRTALLKGPAMLPLIDLPVVAALYAASGAPGGPPYCSCCSSSPAPP